MSCCDWPWSRKEDVCVIFFASRGVYPEACVDIVNNTCRSKRHAVCIHRRICRLAIDNRLYLDQQFHAERVHAWIQVQGLTSFINRLRFDQTVVAAIQRVPIKDQSNSTTSANTL